MFIKHFRCQPVARRRIINITTLVTCCFRFEKLKIPSLQPYIEDRYSYLLHHFGREVEVISKVSTQTSVDLSCSGKGSVVLTIWVKGFSKASESSVDCCYPLYEPIGALRIFESDVGEAAFAFGQLSVLMPHVGEKARFQTEPPL